MDKINPYYRYIFIVLVYKNIKILEEFFMNFNIKESHVIVVNSYYDEFTEEECRQVAIKYAASYINVANKGYSYGNNQGISYANQNFKYDFLIVSNSDIKIEEWPDLTNYIGKMYVIAPDILATSMGNKSQNPNLPHFSKKLYYNFLNKGYSSNKQIFLHIAHIYSRFTREIYLIRSRFLKICRFRIFSAHGAFIIFTEQAVRKLFPVFYDKMFLYNEELYLAFRCKELDIPIIYDSTIKILHQEGASSASIHIIEENRKSFDILNSCLVDNNLI